MGRRFYNNVTNEEEGSNIVRMPRQARLDAPWFKDNLTGEEEGGATLLPQSLIDNCLGSRFHGVSSLTSVIHAGYPIDKS